MLHTGWKVNILAVKNKHNFEEIDIELFKT